MATEVVRLKANLTLPNQYLASATSLLSQYEEEITMDPMNTARIQSTDFKVETNPKVSNRNNLYINKSLNSEKQNTNRSKND